MCANFVDMVPESLIAFNRPRERTICNFRKRETHLDGLGTIEKWSLSMHWTWTKFSRIVGCWSPRLFHCIYAFHENTRDSAFLVRNTGRLGLIYKEGTVTRPINESREFLSIRNASRTKRFIMKIMEGHVCLRIFVHDALMNVVTEKDTIPVWRNRVALGLKMNWNLVVEIVGTALPTYATVAV